MRYATLRVVIHAIHSLVSVFRSHDGGEDSLSFIFLDSSWPTRNAERRREKEVRFVEKRINGTWTRSGNGARYVVVVALTQFLCYFPLRLPPLPLPSPPGYSVARSNEDNDDSRQLSAVR